MKYFIRSTIILGLFLSVPVVQALAATTITNVSVSTSVLMEIYRAYDAGRTTVPFINSSIFQMSVQSDQAADSFEFRFEVRDGATRVASVDFNTTKPLAVGNTQFNATQIRTGASAIQFNTDYINANNVADAIQGRDGVISGQFRVVLIPLNPSGPPYSLQYALFTPPSALNMPPIPVLPNNVEVNTPLPLFAWTPVKNAASYEVLVSPNKDPRVNTYWRSGKLKTTQVLYSSAARMLQNGHKYYWLVIGYDGFDKPIGGISGRSSIAWFKINSTARATTAVSPPEADAALRAVVPDQAVFNELTDYRPVAVESTHKDLADLLRQLRDGSAKVTAFELE